MVRIRGQHFAKNSNHKRFCECHARIKKLDTFNIEALNLLESRYFKKSDSEYQLKIS